MIIAKKLHNPIKLIAFIIPRVVFCKITAFVVFFELLAEDSLE